jgi:hypothetical protein
MNTNSNVSSCFINPPAVVLCVTLSASLNRFSNKSTTKDKYLHVVSLHKKNVILTKDNLAKRNLKFLMISR